MKKSEPPSTQMTFLGVMFDSSNMTMRVPPDKLRVGISRILEVQQPGGQKRPDRPFLHAPALLRKMMLT